MTMIPPRRRDRVAALGLLGGLTAATLTLASGPASAVDVRAAAVLTPLAISAVTAESAGAIESAESADAFATVEAIPATTNPIEFDRLPSRARWVMHYDVERIVDASETIHSIIEEFDLLEAGQYIEEFADAVGIDGREDIRSITITGEGRDLDHDEDFVAEHRPVIVLDLVDGIAERLERMTDAEPDLERVRGAGRTYVAWEDGGEEWLGAIVVPGSGGTGSRFIMSPGGTDVMDDACAAWEGSRRDGWDDDRGEGRGLRPFDAARSALVYLDIPGSINVLEEEMLEPIFMRNTRTRIAMREGDDASMDLLLGLDLRTDADADDTAAFLEGIRSLASLAGRAGIEEENVDLMQSIDVRRSGERVSLRLSIPESMLERMQGYHDDHDHDDHDHDEEDHEDHEDHEEEDDDWDDWDGDMNAA